MPRIFQFYIRHCAIGFAIAAAFVGVLLWFNIANLWHLISTSDVGAMALIVFWALNGIVFAGVQTGFAVMMMAEDTDDSGDGGGHAAARVPVRAEVHKPRDGLR